MKTFTLSICLLLCTMLHAQNNQALLTQIEQANAALTTIEGKFAQTKTLAANGKQLKSTGTIYLTGTEQMAMHYDAPSTDLLIINGNRFYMVRGKKKNNFNTEKNKTMRALRNTLLHCVHGCPATLAQENEAEVSTSQTAEGTTVTLTSKKKTPRGYEKIILLYAPQTHLLTRMEMIEWGGNSTLYEMSQLKTNGEISGTVYTVEQ